LCSHNSSSSAAAPARRCASATNEIFGIEWVKAMPRCVHRPARHHYLLDSACARGRHTVAGLSRVATRYRPALFAIRDSEATAESAGVDSFRTKLGVYVLVAAATGMIGALIYLQKARISPDGRVFGAGLERLRDFYRHHRRGRYD